MGPRTQKGDVGKAYNSVVDEWEKKIRDPSGYHFWSYRVFDRVIQPHADGSRAIIDVGCGRGTWLADQIGHDGNRLLVGIDVSCKMAIKAQNYGCPIVVGDAERLPFKNHSFDLVVSRGDAISQAYNPLDAFSEVNRVLMPGGHVCFEMGWCNTPFEGLCHEDGEALYRKDTVRSKDVGILIMKRYHLPEELRIIAEEELGDEEYYPTKWPEETLVRATTVEERQVVAGQGTQNIPQHQETDDHGGLRLLPTTPGDSSSFIPLLIVFLVTPVALDTTDIPP